MILKAFVPLERKPLTIHTRHSVGDVRDHPKPRIFSRMAPKVSRTKSRPFSAWALAKLAILAVSLARCVLRPTWQSSWMLVLPPLLLLVDGHRLDNASGDPDGHVTMTRLVEGRRFTSGRHLVDTRLRIIPSWSWKVSLQTF
jgi:hypothetical protein